MIKLNFIIFLFPVTVFAQIDPDFSKPIQLSGDFSSINLNSKEGEYRGSFVAQQGSMKIEGDQLKLKQKQNKELDTIIAFGKPLKFKKKNYKTGELISGNAQKITYDANKLLVILEGNAEILSDSGKSLSSQIITYGLTSGEIKAIGSAQRRVQMVIPANSKRESSPLVK